MTRIVLAFAALLLLPACSQIEQDMSMHGQVMQNTQAQALPPYHVTQSFSAQR